MVDMTAYGLSFITGVLGSFHCIGMCGGFPILISGASGHKRNISGQLLYNFGRVFTYFFLGVLVGALGFMIKEMEPMLGFQVGLTVVLGLVIILAGLQMTGLVGEGRIPGFSSFYTLLKNTMASFLKRKGKTAAFSLGVMNGFLPCPLVYGFLLVSLTAGSPHKSGLMMLAMGLGTVPAVFLVAAVHRHVSPYLRSRLSRTVPGILIIIFGVITVARAVLPTGFGERIHDICGF